ncbi:BON domain-containing protein [Agrobacterium vitis]|nr:BON domain-containing protein [Agrobacterium vitis]WEO71884.1 BON domain-containing protein [Agrobacterium vitis]
MATSFALNQPVGDALALVKLHANKEESVMVFKPAKTFGEAPEIVEENPPLAELETAVASQLAGSDGIDASDIEVIALGNEICLRGLVYSESEVDRAIEVALSVPGVFKVSVDLEIVERTIH